MTGKDNTESVVIPTAGLYAVPQFTLMSLAKFFFQFIPSHLIIGTYIIPIVLLRLKHEIELC